MSLRLWPVVIIYLLLLFNSICGWTDLSLKYSIYEVTAFNQRERSVLHHMQVKSDHLVFLNSITNEASSPMIVIVKDSHVTWFEQNLQVHEIEHTKIHKDSVLKEFKAFADKYKIDRSIPPVKSPILLERFLDYSLSLKWIQNTIKKHTGLIEKIVLGSTVEKREIFVLKIAKGIQKPAVFILGGEQGRDWMSPVVILNFLNLILMNQSDQLTEMYDLYIMPFFNPDGYEYSIKQDRFWNKNRNLFYPLISCSDNEIAVGVNIDRNFFLNASTYIPYSECDSIYVGHKSLAEEESKALAQFLNTIATKLMAFINVRGFGKLITIPYATQNHFANNYAIMIELLLHASDKVYEKYKVLYTLCNTGGCLYNHTGNSPDWVKSNMNVPIVYTLFLNHEDTVLPRIDRVDNLTQHFSIIARETLLLAHSIYGPLFNSGWKLCGKLSVVVVLMVFYEIKLVYS